MTVKNELYQLAEKINADPVHIKDEKNRVFQVDLEESGPIQIFLKDGKVIVEEGAPHQSEVTLKLSEENFSKLLKGDLNTTIAFMTGSLKVDGKMGLALKLQEIVNNYQ